MSRSGYLEDASMMQGERRKRSPTVRMILAYLIGLLLLTPAILGLYWELLLP